MVITKIRPRTKVYVSVKKKNHFGPVLFLVKERKKRKEMGQFDLSST